MSREIEFRVYDKDLAKYLDGCETDSLMAELDGNEAGVFTIKQICPGRYIFEQFTGVLDRNGKKIYDGDIVRLFYAAVPSRYSEDVIIVWDDKYTGWKGKRPDVGGLVFLPLSEPTQYEMEVIGNINQNKNFLEENKKK